MATILYSRSLLLNHLTLFDCCVFAVKQILSFFLIRKSNFWAETEHSYFFLQFEPENVVKMFVSYLLWYFHKSVGPGTYERDCYLL